MTSLDSTSHETFTQTFESLALENITALAHERKAQGWRYVQTLGVNTEEGIDIIYSFMKDGQLVNSVVTGVQKTDTVPSITDDFFAAFVFENELSDLFGVNVENIAIDFGGNFYVTAVKEPMTVISPEQKAAREKAKKLAAAKAAKEAGAQTQKAPANDEAMEAKLAAMDPEKAAKVRAAMEAKAKKEAAEKQAQSDAELEAKLAGMDPEKAAKVRAAMEAKAKKEAAKAPAAAEVDIPGVSVEAVLASAQSAYATESTMPVQEAMATQHGEAPTTVISLENAEAAAQAVLEARENENAHPKEGE